MQFWREHLLKDLNISHTFYMKILHDELIWSCEGTVQYRNVSEWVLKIREIEMLKIWAGSRCVLRYNAIWAESLVSRYKLHLSSLAAERRSTQLRFISPVVGKWKKILEIYHRFTWHLFWIMFLFDWMYSVLASLGNDMIVMRLSQPC